MGMRMAASEVYENMFMCVCVYVSDLYHQRQTEDRLEIEFKKNK